MQANIFRVGDVVTLKGHSNERMVIEDIGFDQCQNYHKDYWRCVWISNPEHALVTKKMEASFRYTSLRFDSSIAHSERIRELRELKN